MSKDKKIVKEVHVHHYHHSDRSSHPYRKDPSNPPPEHKTTLKNVVKAVDRNPLDFAVNFLLALIFPGADVK